MLQIQEPATTVRASAPQFDPNCFYVRDSNAVVVTNGGHVRFVGNGGHSMTLRTERPALWSQLLQELAAPVSGHVVRRIAEAIPELDDALWRSLLFAGFVLKSEDKDALSAERDRAFSENRGFDLVPRETVCGHLVVACTGSIVSGLMAPTILSLSYSRFQEKLDVVLTQTAQKFLTQDLLESYGIRTWTDAFARRNDINVPHVQLGRSADCILVMPASANSLYRLAHGTCTDLLSLTVTASRAPVVVVPAMNDAMWNNPAVQRNVALLREDGVNVVEPTFIFGAADLATQGQPMYGGHGSLWAGPRTLMDTLEAIIRSQPTKPK